MEMQFPSSIAPNCGWSMLCWGLLVDYCTVDFVASSTLEGSWILVHSVLWQFDNDDDEIYQAPFPLPLDLLYVFPSQYRVFDIGIHPGDEKEKACLE
jgi:hypothetical protein